MFAFILCLSIAANVVVSQVVPVVTSVQLQPPVTSARVITRGVVTKGVVASQTVSSTIPNEQISAQSNDNLMSEPQQCDSTSCSLLSSTVNPTRAGSELIQTAAPQQIQSANSLLAGSANTAPLESSIIEDAGSSNLSTPAATPGISMPDRTVSLEQQ